MLVTAIRGYVAALAVGNAAFWTVGLIRTLLFGPPADSGAGLAGLLVLIVFTLVVSFITTIVPFILFCAISIIFRIRAWAYFVACGATMGLLITALLIGPGWREWQNWSRFSMFWQHLAIAGGIGGLTYWWIAVRPRRVAGTAADSAIG